MRAQAVTKHLRASCPVGPSGSGSSLPSWLWRGGLPWVGQLSQALPWARGHHGSC